MTVDDVVAIARYGAKVQLAPAARKRSTDAYLFDLEPDGKRIIQDPLSFRDDNQRNGAAWESWSRLKKNILIQINSSDHNPAVVPGSWRTWRTSPARRWRGRGSPWTTRFAWSRRRRSRRRTG
jgi:histidine ammonia-lyase